jgi:endonuclease/exonuclease/phosphatase (EEP) superfamily protein YafD
MTSTEPSTVDSGPPLGALTGSHRRVRWCLGTRLVVAATLAWTVFLVAHLLLAGHWWLWLLVEAMPPLTFLAVPLLLLAVAPLARPARRWLIAVLAVTLVIGAHLAGINMRALAGTTPDSGAMKVFAWSTDIWDMADDPNHFFAYLRAQDADVYLLQEYLYWDNDAILVHDEARLRAEFPGYHIAVEGELLTLSRLPITTHPRPVTQGGTDWYWQGNKAQRADVQIGDRVLSVYNVHLPVPYRLQFSPLTGTFYQFIRDEYAHRRSELASLRADLAGNRNPILVVGDFNTAWAGDLMPLGHGLRRQDPTDGFLPLSWPTSTFWYPRLWRLDWAFATGDVQVNQYRFRPNEGLSDHLAQELLISVR